jgi:Glycosyltransferase family 92
MTTPVVTVTASNNTSISTLAMPHLLLNDNGNPIPGTAACLLYHNDNSWLVEWIAYHYYVAGLRTLIITVDPASTTQPTEILDRWRPYMQIIEWHDDHVDMNYRVRVRNSEFAKVDAMINRQSHFFRKCAARLQKMDNVTWTWYHDADEYVILEPEVVKDAAQRMREPSSVLKYFYAMKEQRVDMHNRSCFLSPRRLVGTQESPSLPRDYDASVTELFNVSQFNTWRYRIRNAFTDSSNNGNAKSFLDVTKVDTWKDRIGAHRVSAQLCQPVPEPSRGSAFVSIMHYLGVWPQYARIGEVRMQLHRNRQIWEFRSQIGRDKPVDAPSHWLSGFVEHMGVERAQALLADVGVAVDDVGPDPGNWTLSVEAVNVTLGHLGGKNGRYESYLRQWSEKQRPSDITTKGI